MEQHRPISARRRNRIWLGIVLVAVLACGSLVALKLYRRSHPRGAYGYYAAGVRSLNAKNFPRAFKFLSEAARLESTNVTYLSAASRAAAMTGQKDEALRYAQMAWEYGDKTLDQFRVILSSLDRRDASNQLPQALKLASQLPPGPGSPELRGDVYFYFGRTDLALTNWLALLATNSSPRAAVKAAEAFLSMKEQQKAIDLLERELSRDKLDDNGFAALATIYAMDDALHTNALRVFDEAKKRGRYSDEFKLAHALTCLIEQKVDAARRLFETLKEPADDKASIPSRANARLFLGAILLNQQDRKAIEELQSLNGQMPTGPIKEAEGLFYKALLLLADNRPGALELLRNAQRLAPEHGAIALIYANVSAKAGHYADAVAACKAIRGPVSRWPALMLELASALHKAGRPQEALQVLGRLHARNFYSKQSLSLFRDAAYASNLVQDGRRMQSFLENQFPNDPDVRFFSGYSALRARDYDKAAAIFRELDREFPQEVRYKLADAQVRMARGDARAALDTLKKIEARPELIAPFLGIAHARLQEWPQALEAFRQTPTASQPASVLVEYGMVLLQMNRPAEAARQFEQAFARDPRQLDARLGLALAAYSQGGEQLENARKHAALLLGNPELDAARLLFLAAAELRYAAYTNALEYCRLAIAKDGNFVDARALRGSILAMQGRFQEAEQDLAWAASRKPESVPIKRDLASLHLRSEQYERAAREIEALVAASPNDTEFLLMKFDLLGRSGQLAAAQQFLAGLKPSLPSAQFALCNAWIAQLRGDVTEASSYLMPHLTNAAVAFQWGRLQFDSGNAPAAMDGLRRARLNAAQWTALAALAERRQVTNVAVACYEEALILAPDDPGLLNNWAWNSAQLPKFDGNKVITACRRAHAALPRNLDVLDTYADVLLRCRRYEECVNLLEANQVLVNRAPQLLWALGSAYQATGEKQKALVAFQRCQTVLNTNSPVRFNTSEIPERIAQLRVGGK